MSIIKQLGMKKIPFNIPPVTGKELQYINDVMDNRYFSGNGSFDHRCSTWLEQHFACRKVLLTPSCTHALELAAILANIGPGDEVIMPSYTFVSTANAFVLRGAQIVFVDIRPDTMNIDEKIIESAINDKTRVIVAVHYAGIACDMDTIMELANRYNLLVIEDAAQAVMCQYRGKYLGTIGHLGCYSFHETKNYTCGEGGALVINDDRFIERAEIIREKGTNRSKFFRGQVDKYTWVDLGSSYLPSEFNAAYLYAQLEMAEVINSDRLQSWEQYYQGLKPLAEASYIDLPFIPGECIHNAHMFYIKVGDLEERSKLIGYLLEHGIQSVFHYVPLHGSLAGMKYGRFHGEDRYTSRESERLLRLPLYYQLDLNDLNYVIEILTKWMKR